MRSNRWTAAVLAAVAVAVPVRGGEIWNNGPPQGLSALNIVDQTVSNSFTIQSPTSVTSIQAGLWVSTSDVPTAVNWSIGTGPFGNDIGSAKAAHLSSVFLFSNGFGFDIYESTFTLNGALPEAGTFWLTLDGGVSQFGSTVEWDVTDGPSQALVEGATGSPGSESFQVFNAVSGPVVPEPAGVTLVVIAGAGYIFGTRRKSNPRPR
jgi:hypothetical protein